MRGFVVGWLSPRDAAAADHPDLESYAKSPDDGLELFVAEQRRKWRFKVFPLDKCTVEVLYS